MEWPKFSFGEEGWGQLKKFYTFDEECMERHATTRMVRTTFLVTGVLGGLLGRKETERRLQMYTTGVSFGSAGNRFSRSMDFRILSFMKHGFKYGMRSSVLVGSILMSTTHVTLYRDRFSLWYMPTFAGAVCFLSHRASACALFSFPLGLYGLIQATMLGITAGSTISGGVYLSSLYLDKTVDEVYRLYRTEYEAETREQKQWSREMRQLMKESGVWSSFTANKMLKQRREAQAAGLDIEEDDEEVNATK